MKRIIFSFLFVCCLINYSKSQVRDTTVYLFPEIQPTFKFDNCLNTHESIKEYFLTNFKMPPELESCGFTGKIYVSFVIEQDSSISNLKVARGIDNRLDSIVLKCAQSMQKWTPGIHNEKTVRTQYTLPIDIYWLYGKIEKD